MPHRDLYSTVDPQSHGTAADPSGAPADRWQTLAGDGRCAPPMSVKEGLAIGNYVVERELGRGGMGVVYTVRHRQFSDRRYALKLIATATSSSSAVTRFQREIELLGRSRHEYLLYAIDAGLHGTDPYLVTELVEGYDIAKILLAYGPFQLSDACEIGRQLALGLQVVHAANMVHRDIKPQNVMLQPDGQIKILDLGLASLRDGSSRNGRTAEGIVGTPVYMPPEQWRGEPPSPACDMYAFGCMLFEMLTGAPPFPSERHPTVAEQRAAHLTAAAPSVTLRAPRVPADVAWVIERCLRKSADERPQDWGQIAAVLEQHSRPIDTADMFARVPGHVRSAGDAVTDYDRFIEQMRFPPVAPGARAAFVAVFGCGLSLSVGCLAMAYFGSHATPAWELRFDRLGNPDAPSGIGFTLETVRSLMFLTLVIGVGYSRFSLPLSRLFSIRLNTWRVWVARLLLASTLVIFLGAEANRLWQPEHAAAGMVTWAEQHGIGTTAAAELPSYRWYLGYAVVQYTLILGGVTVLPVLQFLLSDLQYVSRSLALFTEAQRREPNAMSAVDRLSTLARHFRRLATRYVDTAGVLAMGIQYECWLGRWTLSETGFMLEVVGMVLCAAVMIAILAFVATRYSEAVEATTFGRGGKTDHRIEQLVGRFDVVWLMRSAFFSRPSGLAVLSLLILPLMSIGRR